MKSRFIVASLVASTAMLVAGTYAGSHTYDGTRAAAAQPAGRVSQTGAPAVIAGRVTALHGTTATVATPSQPVCPAPSTPTAGSAVRCNAIVAGASVQVDTAHAVFETAAGAPVQGAQPRLAVGDSVVAVGALASGASSTTRGGQQGLRATVIQRASPCVSR